ncbi:MAG TPA: DUF2231 domain-containing protein [Terriglobales bacterium]
MSTSLLGDPLRSRTHSKTEEMTMFQLPPIPALDGLHPLIIHFPIALLFVAPIFVLVGAVLQPRRGRPLLYSALVLMVLGTASIFVAIESGEAAAKLADRTPEINRVIEHHEDFAENTRLAFSILTVVFAGVLFVPMALKKELSRVASTVLPLAFLCIYLGGMLMVANTADQGGRLVHQYGVHSMVAPEGAPANAAQPAQPTNDKD